ncbi:receptor-interacting serine/threonine-protein kinase 3 [Bombina bombina]|uniref:receptor-interacting serine/threonine-protein kinase 3 n=1 Tax=Bombina bombina TaxID=8345 RepID=UPI00235B03DB|nr:receptor-interacting serine/threonine-protein kinase 3 [Bombina bombina]
MLQLPEGDLQGLIRIDMGGFGVIYRGRSQTLGMDIALKTILRKDLDSLKKEKEIMHRASYTYVLRLLGIYERKGTIEYGLVMEYMPNGSLYCLLNKYSKSKTEVPWALRFQIIHQVALGMNYLHYLSPPIIHRDLKPGNVLLNKSLDVQLTDFGLAKNVGSETSSMDVKGTLAYIPPEAYQKDYRPTKMFDVFSFGILMWSVVSGQEPYRDAPKFLCSVLHNQRPDLNLVNEKQKMVPQCKELMIKCWNGVVILRPTFQKCIQQTEVMNKAYEAETESAVQEVKHFLKNYSYEQKEVEPDSASESIVTSESFHISIFNDSHTQAQGEDQQLNSCGVITSRIPADLKAVEFLEKKIIAIIKAEPPMTMILEGLRSERIINQEEQRSIECLQPEMEQVRATIHAVIKKGKFSCLKFLQLLEKTNSSLVEQLFAETK